MAKKIEMTDEVREQLIGLLPMSKDAEFDFIPDMFEKIPEDYQPVFTIRQLTNEQVIHIKEMMYMESKSSDKKGAKKKGQIIAELKRKEDEYLDIVHSVLVRWSNLYNLDTKEVQEYDGDIETLKRLPEILRTDIFSEAIRITGFLPKGIM